MKWIKAIAELATWALLAPILMLGYFAGWVWIGLAAGFRLAAITCEAMGDDRHAWTVRVTRRPHPAAQEGANGS